MRRLALLTLIVLFTLPANGGGKTPSLPAIAATCKNAGFADDVCNPSPTLAPLIGIHEARLANGNTGLLYVTVAGISFTSALNEERFLLRYENITAICADHTTTEATKGDARFTTAVRQRHYYRITTAQREVVFWVPGGTKEANEVALFYHAVLKQILAVTDCTLRPRE